MGAKSLKTLGEFVINEPIAGVKQTINKAHVLILCLASSRFEAVHLAFAIARGTMGKALINLVTRQRTDYS